MTDSGICALDKTKLLDSAGSVINPAKEDGNLASILTHLNSFTLIITDKDSHFTTELAQYVTEEENISGLNSNKVMIYAIVIESDQQLNFRLHFFSKDIFADADLDVDTWIGFVDLDLVSHGVRYGNTNQWLLNITSDQGQLLYEDEDETEELHLALENLSSQTKNAGATGEIKLKIFYK